MKKQESPKFLNGRLLPQKPLRHKMPKTNFYYSNREWFKDNTAESCHRSGTEVKSTHECTSLPKIKSSGSIIAVSEENPAVTLNNNEITDVEKDFQSREYNEYKTKLPSKAYMETYIRHDAAKWKSTPVPGFRTCAYFDKHREDSTRNYNTIYEKKRGVVPKYGGYVPGLKFRYGSPFGQLTYNARELGMDKNKSRTWGGAVSLF